MSNKDVFAKSVFDLPNHRKNEGYITALTGTFAEYQNQLNNFDGVLKDRLSVNDTMIQKQCACILESLTSYYQGYPHQAYVILKECLDELKAADLLPIQDSAVTEGLDEYYRVRTGQGKFSKNSLFHIPFQLREKVSTQRYSIPGLPCLYLGDSIYVCWEELSRPDINQMNVSRFDLNDSGFRFLFFNETADDYRGRCFQGNDNGVPALLPGLVSFLTYYPLLLACSFQVSKPNEVFKPEYIIPQLLLQWIVGEQDLDGIKYRSNRIKRSDNMAGTFANLAIPVKTMQDSGYCAELSGRISYTEPVSWQIIDISNDRKKLKLSINEIAQSTRRVRKIELIEGQSVDYFLTKFGKFEEKLRTISASKI